MRVLAVTHGPSVGPGVFADAVQEAGHDLLEWPVQLGGKAPEGADAVIVLGGAMHPDEDERHGWLTGELRWLQALLDRGTPLLGICLGHQVTGIALGVSTYKLPFGHRGSNHPVLERKSGRVLVTSQNHGFAVEPSEGSEATHVSLYDGTVEGFDFPELRARSVQFHPEAGPGPHDAWPILESFVEELR